MIASVLIILGALAGDHHIAVAILGAVTGIITAVLSLIKGPRIAQQTAAVCEQLETSEGED